MAGPVFPKEDGQSIAWGLLNQLIRSQQRVARPSRVVRNPSAATGIPVAHFSGEGKGAIVKIKQVMTKDPTCCVPSDSAQLAAKVMRDEDTGIVPVIENEESRTIVGVVTDRDLCMNIVADGRDPRTTPVHECMTTKVVHCSPQDSVERTTALMRENRIRRIAVVDEERRLVGIVSMADVVGRANVKTTETHETLKTVSAPTGEPSKPRAKSRTAA